MILARYKNAVTYILYMLFFLSAGVRGVNDFIASGSEFSTLAISLILLYGLLLASERWISRHYTWYIYIYLAIQTSIIFALLALSPRLDYFGLLFIPLSLQAMLHLPIRTGYIWIGIYMVVSAVGLIISYGLQDALPFIFIYGAAYIFVASYATVTRQAEEAQEKSQTLLIELQQAHAQLQDYANQAQELAVLEERNRLARDLHDSVTQALYSLTLYSAAASRQLEAGEIEITAEHLQDLQKTAQQALQEMRLLIFELRPSALEEEGLAGAIKARLEAVETRTGIEVSLDVNGDTRLPLDIEEALYRIAQESLNNILKHAHASHVHVGLTLHDNSAVMVIDDDGIGFEGTAVDFGGGLGLQGMEERARQIGAIISITSIPEEGTQVRVEVPL